MGLLANDRCWCGSSTKFKRCHGDVHRLRRERVVPGRVSPMRSVPAGIERPDYVTTGQIGTGRGVQVHDAATLERMRCACAVAAEVLLRTADAAEPGITTDQLDEIAHDTYVELGAYPSTLGYRGYPKSICTSVNGVICHGIPDDRPLAEGDIVNIDVTAFAAGMHGDTSATVCVGVVDEPTRGLVETTRAATLRGIDAVRVGEPLQNVARAIEPFVQGRGYGIVREYGGHGIGSTFHASPHVQHHVDRADAFVVVPAMTFTIEPMVTVGRPRFDQLDDGWTERLRDDLPSAQFEHTVLATPDGAEILTVTASGESAVSRPTR